MAPISSTWDIYFDEEHYQGYKGWLLTADYALQDNVGLTAYYGFKNKTNKRFGNNEKQPEYYRVDLNYQF